MANEPDNTNIQKRYAEQVATDLEDNEREREGVRSQIADLRARLERLDSEHAWLSTLRGTVTGAAAAPESVDSAALGTPAELPGGHAEASPAEAAASQAVPQPRRAKTAARQARKKAPTAAAKNGPTLRELVHGVLANHHERRMVSEVVKELTEAHPDRAASPQVVRNTLEGLVAKNEAERERKQGSVFYTVPQNDIAPEPAAEQAVADV